MRAEHTLVYDAPAADWLEALPLGNGRLGAMVFGGRPLAGDSAPVGTLEHRFQLNDGSAWSGSPHSEALEPVFSRERADRILATSRRQISAGHFTAAHETLKELQHRHSQSYLPFADLFLTVAHSDVPGSAPETDTHTGNPPKAYRRTLDLTRAVNSTTYQVDGHTVRVDAFASHDPSVMVISVETDAPGGLDLALRLDSQLRILRRSSSPVLAALELKMPSDVAPSHDGGLVQYSDDDALSLQGAVVVAWKHNGTAAVADSAALAGNTDDDGLAATGVRHAVIYVTTETTFMGLGQQPEGTASDAVAAARETLDAAMAAGRGALLARHEDSHGRLYDSSRISLDVPAWTGTNTGHRLRAANAHPDGPLAADPGLAALLFNYGRYLLISSSRTGPPGSRKGTAWRGTPANLQGIWNDKLPAPWSSNFTTNINLEMNYWGAEPTGLAECAEPLFALIEALQETGAATAQEYYGARGWAVHHNSDIWGYSKPVGDGTHSPEWSFWPMAGLWLVRHLWEHLRFSDPAGSGRADASADAVAVAGTAGFAREAAWPAIRGAAELALDLMMEFPDGTLGTSPSTSPENNFAVGSAGPDQPGSPAAAALSSTLDLTLINDVFRMLCSLAEELGMEEDSVVAEARAALPRLPEPMPGRNGRLREWLADPEEWEPEHRHVSHLYLAYPGDTPLSPGLEAAVSASLDGRGDDSTGWSLAWKILLRARLRQPGKVSDLFRLYFRDMTTDRGGHGGGLYPNLFGAHPPFQIDGNFGFVAGLAECLLQSHRTQGSLQEIELLPALPVELSDGAASRLRARPGVEVDLEWRDGLLTAATLTSPLQRRVLVRYGARVQEVHLEPRQATVLNVASFEGSFDGAALPS
ncbi:alpha-L-fucosidase 2 [Arthrobacter pascens]|uniref:glycosyl hydrolase family 95 catalytic domain-containing protein n=1 Tax=Arthrobacter pascens TaxID=1677 RepID=UPI00278D08BF|nr:glycoside hydrolase N-terminal domain-containing protein [Arthrobacter pascens]MDQ0677175.1 alpha-L-fucosidase 2 [Arthrobacter pascens]